MVRKVKWSLGSTGAMGSNERRLQQVFYWRAWEIGSGGTERRFVGSLPGFLEFSFRILLPLSLSFTIRSLKSSLNNLSQEIFLVLVYEKVKLFPRKNLLLLRFTSKKAFFISSHTIVLNLGIHSCPDPLPTS